MGQGRRRRWGASGEGIEMEVRDLLGGICGPRLTADKSSRSSCFTKIFVTGLALGRPLTRAWRLLTPPILWLLSTLLHLRPCSHSPGSETAPDLGLSLFLLTKRDFLEFAVSRGFLSTLRKITMAIHQIYAKNILSHVLPSRLFQSDSRIDTIALRYDSPSSLFKLATMAMSSSPARKLHNVSRPIIINLASSASSPLGCRGIW